MVLRGDPAAAGKGHVTVVRVVEVEQALELVAVEVEVAENVKVIKVGPAQEEMVLMVLSLFEFMNSAVS